MSTARCAGRETPHRSDVAAVAELRSGSAEMPPRGQQPARGPEHSRSVPGARQSLGTGLSLAGEAIKKALRKAVRYANQPLVSIRKKPRVRPTPPPGPPPPQPPPPLTPEEQRFNEWARRNGLSEKDLDLLNDMSGGAPSANQRAAARIPEARKAGTDKPRP